MKMSRNSKSILINIMIFTMSILFSGCWDKTELNQITLVMGIGIDKVPGNEPILVTLEVVSPDTTNRGSDQSGRGSNSTIQTSKGNTVYDAIENLLKSTAVKLDFSHNQIIILSKEICQSGITEPLDYINRNTPFRVTEWILVSNKTAKEILESRMPNEEITSNGIHKMMHIFNGTGYTMPVMANQFYVELLGVAKTSFLPLIDIEKSEDNPSGKIKIEKTAIIKDDHLVGTLTNEESRVLMWLINKFKGNMIIFPFEPDNSITLEVYEVSSKIVPYKSNGEFRFKITCRGKAILREVKNMKIDEEKVEKIEQNANLVLTNKFSKLIEKSQKELDTDFIGFGKAIHNEAPQEWFAIEKKWDDIYPKTKYKIDFKIDLTNIGIIKNSQSPKDEKEEKK